MPELVFKQEVLVASWICALLEIPIPIPCTAIGVGNYGKLVAGALYHNQQLDPSGKPFMIEMSFATIDKTWCSRAILDGLLGYPFRQQGVRRVQSTVSKRNRRVRQFLEHLGFTLEGVGRQAWHAGGDACCYSMLSREFFSSQWNMKRGQIRTLASRSPRPSQDLGSTDCQQQGNGAL